MKKLSVEELETKSRELFRNIVALYDREMITDIVHVHTCIDEIKERLTKIKLHKEKEYDEILKAYWTYRAVGVMSEDMEAIYHDTLEKFSQE